jgi:hypothetical protein
MSTKFRNVLAVALTTLVLTASVGASAGVMDKAAEKLRDKGSSEKSEQKSDSKPSQQPNAPSQRGDRSRGSSGGMAPPRDSGGGPRNNDRGSRSDDRGPNRDGQQGGRASGSGRDLSDDLARLQGRGSDRGGGSRGGRDHRPRPPRVVERLPSGHRDYYWNGNRYYAYGGHWYRPYGSSFVTVGVPFGLFVPVLPGLYTSFWFGSTRYFYADNTYYVYEPARRGYVVTRSPYGDDEEYDDQGSGDDLYIYPARGQSEQQQADDRYQCHRWAAQESHYDPLDDDYNTDLRKDYQRAMTACLTGRGYTVN